MDSSLWALVLVARETILQPVRSNKLINCGQKCECFWLFRAFEIAATKQRFAHVCQESSSDVFFEPLAVQNKSQK